MSAHQGLEEGRHVFGRPEMQKALASARASNGGLHQCLSGGASITFTTSSISALLGSCRYCEA